MENIGAGIAFIAGMLTFLSPCVLPLIPGYLVLVAGASMEKKSPDYRKAMEASGMFVMGFALSFTVSGIWGTGLTSPPIRTIGA